MNEARNVRTPILRWLRSLPGAYFEVSNPGSNTGKPDITGSLNGRYVAIETKRPGKKPEKHQDYIHRKLRDAGAIVIVAHSLREAQLALEYELGRRAA